MRATHPLMVPLCLAWLGLAGCGGGGNDAPDCTADGFACAAAEECCTGNCDPTASVCIQLPGACLAAGQPCQVGPDCCSSACVDYECAGTQCTPDDGSCSSDSECCSGACADTCTPLNPSCRTSGNPCETGADCCSQYCLNDLCDASPSYCTQSGDTCSNDIECCGGFCAKQGDAALGLCQLVPASGAGGCTTAGEVCTPELDGNGNYTCGSSCCSRACFPFGSSGMTICQPPSGCHPTGEICFTDEDCCGSASQPDGDTAMITCSKEGDNPVGRCDNGNACTPAGGICRLQTTECSENANCCSGNVLQFDTCHQDNLGIPRCLAAEVDCTDPSSYEGMPCASSADCCGLPCTPSSSDELAPLVCGGQACVPTGGTCTTSADCCATIPCENGVCGDPGACAEYGQSCTEAADCCNGVPCNDNICGVIIE